MYGLTGDPVTDAIAQAKEKLGSVGWFGLAILAGVAYLVLRSGNRR